MVLKILKLEKSYKTFFCINLSSNLGNYSSLAYEGVVTIFWKLFVRVSKFECGLTIPKHDVIGMYHINRSNQNAD